MHEYFAYSWHDQSCLCTPFACAMVFSDAFALIFFMPMNKLQLYFFTKKPKISRSSLCLSSFDWDGLWYPFNGFLVTLEFQVKLYNTELWIKKYFQSGFLFLWTVCLCNGQISCAFILSLDRIKSCLFTPFDCAIVFFLHFCIDFVFANEWASALFFYKKNLKFQGA